MARKRKIALGSGRIYHAKGARQSYKYAMENLQRSITAANAGDCFKALENFAVGNQDLGNFFTEHKHAVGASRHGFTPLGAPRMKQALSSRRIGALETLSKKCLVK